jgi:RNA polymerase sigma-70 factor (ECF subfamily)
MGVDPAGLERLLRRAQKRDPEALSELVDEYSPRVFGLLFRLTGSRETAEELMQETFLRVVRTIPTYQHDGKFESWLFRIAANLARDDARRTRRRGRPLTLDAFGDDDDTGPPDVPDSRRIDPGRELMKRESGERLSACLAELSEMDREIILLRYFSELPFREIAEMLQVPLGTALARAHRAMQRLRAALEEET